MTQRIRTGLAGYGTAGAVFHAPLIQSVPALELAAVASSRVDTVRAAVPGARVVASLDALLDDASIELVVIATPTALHFEHARAALLAAKHVVVDKPFTLTAAEADALIQLAGQRHRMLTVFQNRRYDNDFLTVQKLLNEQAVGQVYYYEAHYDRFRPALKTGWREQGGPGSGILYDLGAHLVDQALVLFGKPEWVMADAFAQRPVARAVDYFHLVLGYGPRRVVLHGSNLVREPGARFVVHGDGGSFSKIGMDGQEEALRSGLRPGASQWGYDDPACYGVLTRADGTKETVTTVTGDYGRFYRAVVACLQDGDEPPVAAASARDGIQVIEAAVASAAGRRVVSIE